MDAAYEGLKGHTVLVTGAGSGIGRATALAFAREGAFVILADRDLKAATNAAALIAQHAGEALPMEVDVADAASVDAMIGQIVDRRGSLEVLVHSAGIGVERPFLDTQDAEWQRIIDVDLTGSFYCMRAAGRVMAAAGYGRIIVLSSTAGVAGGTGRAAYGAAKGGVILLARCLAVELAERGVTVNALAPGAIETELVAAMHSEATRINYKRSIPANRYGTPEEVAHAALYLGSPGASYVTGHVLAVDGGFLAAGVINRDAAAPVA